MPRVPITDEIIEEMERLQESTGVGLVAVLSRAPDKPPGLNSGIVKGWMSGGIKSADPQHLGYVLRRWRAMPSQRPIDDATRTAVRTERARTRVGAKRLLDGASGLPDGLSHAVVDGWLTGRTRTARSDHLDFVLGLYRALPDDVPPGPRRRVSGARRELVEITPDVLDELRHRRERTGISASRLLSGRRDIPRGLNTSIIANWLCGTTGKARREHLDYVRRLWREAVPRVSVTPEMSAHLRAEMARTGHTPKTILNALSPCPADLRRELVSRLMHGRTTTVREDLLVFLREGLARLPDKHSD